MEDFSESSNMTWQQNGSGEDQWNDLEGDESNGWNEDESGENQWNDLEGDESNGRNEDESGEDQWNDLEGDESNGWNEDESGENQWNDLEGDESNGRNEDESGEDQWNDLEGHESNGWNEDESGEDQWNDLEGDESNGWNKDGSGEDQWNDLEGDESNGWNEDESGEDQWNDLEGDESNGWNEDESNHNVGAVIFQDVYRCYPVSFVEKSNLENGGRIIMPGSAIYRLAYLEIEYPMLFELRNSSTERITHCGVLEFTADEGIIYMPKWMMENMHLQEGNVVNLRSTRVPKATYVKLQPHTKDFLDISNPKSLLEFSLRSYSCLTTGDTIMIAYNNKKYYIDIMETKPSHAVSIIETDCEVDFAQPLDYKEPEKHLPSASSDKECTEVHNDSATKTAPIIPFTGCGRRLDGKTSTQSVEGTSSSMLKWQRTENETKYGNSKPSKTASCRASGKLVFGSKPNANEPKVQTPPKDSLKRTTQELSQVEKPKFQAFTGKKYSLKN